MKFSLVTLTALGVVAAGLYGMSRQPTVDFGSVTGSIGTGMAVKAPRLVSAAPKTERLMAQLVLPRDTVEDVSGPAALVLAQSPSVDLLDEMAQAPAPVNREEARPSSNANAASQPAVDESALRYFAARGDTARLQAEISRLRTLYPSWTPPADPLASPPSSDPQLENLWELYAQARYADVRQAIAARQAQEPGWQPPPDLLDRLKLAEARAILTTASDTKEYESVIRVATDNPGLLTCSEVDVLWRLAQAFAATEKPARARDAYLYILNNCDSSAERLATVQKAGELLPLDMTEELLAKERTVPGGSPEFDSVRDDLARRLVGQGNGDPKLVVAEKYLGRLERLAESQNLASDALLLGWYYYRRDNLGAAERWFRRAVAKEETASAAEGLALTLIRQKSPLEAENVLYRWRDSSDGSKEAYLAAVANLLAMEPPPVLQGEVLARMAPVVIASHNADAAQQFGWYARAMRQPKTAAEWFSTALAWKPDDEPSAYGLALSRNDLNDKPGLAAIQRAWAGKSERIAEVGRPVQHAPGTRRPVLTPSAPTAIGSGQTEMVQERQPMAVEQPALEPMRPAVRAPRVSAAQSSARPNRCWTTSDSRQLTPEQALARGWCLMDLNRPLEAARAFEAAGSSIQPGIRSDAAYGRSLAYLRVGLTDNASVAAADAGQNNTRAVELQSSILANRAVDAFKLGRYREALVALDQRAQIVPEQTDLMSLRGYAYLNLKRRADAQRIFQALADMGDPQGQRGLATMLDPSVQ
ncbi:cellulose synthase [Neorhizobium lilium]|uniref:Cellulose synthase n=1 Tax=Neorhizobium lilium TaxID=2503024 RepID=A0A3S3VHU1_9HYPH|nr:cellulose synthase [Neorhizobium lilium]RWX76976.1 cellulose synthase [Neorhizobium lilium]